MIVGGLVLHIWPDARHKSCITEQLGAPSDRSQPERVLHPIIGTVVGFSLLDAGRVLGACFAELMLWFLGCSCPPSVIAIGLV